MVEEVWLVNATNGSQEELDICFRRSFLQFFAVHLDVEIGFVPAESVLVLQSVSTSCLAKPTGQASLRMRT